MLVEYKESMMKLTSFTVPIFVVVILLGCCQASLAQSREANSPHSMKGYELYSWKFRGEWYFSLLAGTNRLKSRKEVTSLKVRVKGVEALKLRLNWLSRGEEVSWSEGLIPRMVLPPENIIEEVETYCNQHGLILRVSQRDASPASNKTACTRPQIALPSSARHRACFVECAAGDGGR
jgi:hypothetical protein